MKLALRTLFLALLFVSNAFSYTDQITIERKIRENKSSIDFLNVCITNFGDLKIDQFKEVYDLHFNSYVAFLKSDYKKTFKDIYSSQEKQEELYSFLVNDVYLKDSREILDKLSPLIIQSENPKARFYLTLGFRELNHGRNDYMAASATNPKLHSFKIYKYMNAIRRSRRAVRYGLFSLFEAQTNEKKRAIYELLIAEENKSGNDFFKRFAGKKDNEYSSEMSLNYEQKNKDVEENKANSDTGIEQEQKEKTNKPVLTNKVAEKIKFRQEKKAADYLMFFYFDKVNEILREYIKDFNYKMILATLNYLDSIKNPADVIDYRKLKVHHMDNYSRLSKPSAFESFIEKITVDEKTQAVPESGEVQVKEESPQDNKDISKPNIEKKSDNNKQDTSQ